MRKTHAAIMTAYYLQSGMMIPVLSLMLLARGCTVSTLPLVIGVYSVTALLMEVPSGVYADKFGRKRSFILAMGFEALSKVVLLLSHSFGLLALAMVMHGFGRAFASGSMDAMVIDDFIVEHGEEKLPTVTSQIQIIASLGTSGGALLGGLLPIANGYSASIGVSLVFIAAIGIGFALWTKEPVATTLKQEERGRLTLRGNHPLIRILCCYGALAGMMGLIETYWSVRFKPMLPPDSGNTVLGLISGASFLVMTLGSLWSSRMRVKGVNSRWRLYFILQLAMSFNMIVFALQRGAVGFGLLYAGFYTLLGISNVHEQTLLNQLAEGSNRATVLSAASLFMQLVALGATVFASAAAGFIGITGVWLSVGTVATMVFAAMWVWHSLANKRLIATTAKNF